MSGLEVVWRYVTLESMLDFGVSVLMVLMTASLAIWFACSIVEHVLKPKSVHHPNHDLLLRENERLRALLAEAQEKNDYLRKLYRELPPRTKCEGRRAA